MKRAGMLALLILSGGVLAQAPPSHTPPGGHPGPTPLSGGEPTSPALQAATKPADDAGCKECPKPPAWWEKVPPIQPFPRPGWFPNPPTGPGFYSLLDQLNGEWREKPPAYPYPRFSLAQMSFFDIDWSYLDKPTNTELDFFDCLKRRRLLDDCVMVTAGGEVRFRYNHETNSRLLNSGPVPLRGRTNDYGLSRLRAYGDVWVTDRVRFFAEFLSADSYWQDLPALPVDRNRADLLNAFMDVKAAEVAGHPVYVRVGRQELLYGSQRLVSPLEWVNTRRTFDGVKAFWKGEHLSLDAFCVQPVIPDANRFDSVDNNVVFSGLWATYRPTKTRALDLYCLNLDRAGPAATGRAGVVGPQNTTSVGTRLVGSAESGLLWDVEGVLQLGTYSNQCLTAGAATAGVGYFAKDLPATPTFWLYYDWASGDNTPGTGGSRGTFEQLFPFGHYYFGWIDVVGRRNIHDLNASVIAYPTPWITAQAQLHVFYLDSKRDALYNAAGVPIRRDPTGRAGNEVGQEIDLIFNFHLSKHSDILISYSHLFAGEFIRRTATTAAGRQSPDYVYLQYSYRW